MTLISTKKENEMKHLLHFTLVMPKDLSLLYKIYVAIKQNAISIADPSFDCSWSVPEPNAYIVLPEIIASKHDWRAFELIMCDLRFLWRKLLENGIQSIIDTYEVSCSC